MITPLLIALMVVLCMCICQAFPGPPQLLYTYKHSTLCILKYCGWNCPGLLQEFCPEDYYECLYCHWREFWGTGSDPFKIPLQMSNEIRSTAAGKVFDAVTSIRTARSYWLSQLPDLIWCSTFMRFTAFDDKAAFDIHSLPPCAWALLAVILGYMKPWIFNFHLSWEVISFLSSKESAFKWQLNLLQRWKSTGVHSQLAIRTAFASESCAYRQHPN